MEIISSINKLCIEWNDMAYRGRIKYPFVVWIIFEGSLNHLDGARDIGFGQGDDFDRHGGCVQVLTPQYHQGSERLD